ncbi:MAG: flagellar biosynthesis protein FlhF [Woeseiaceae bacterium]
MKIKRYLDKDMRHVLRRVREDQGPDAVILSNRRVDDGIEVIAAIDYDEALVRHAVGLGSSETVEEGGQFDSDALAEIAEDCPSNIPEVLNAELEQTTAGASADSGSEEGSLNDMREELTSLRGLLETQLSGLVWKDSSKRSPLRAQMLRNLARLGVAPDTASMVVDRLEPVTEVRRLWHAPLTTLAKILPVREDTMLEEGGTFAFIGPTGVGKTTSIAKIAARFAMSHNPDDIALISADSFRIGAREHLMAFANIIGAKVHSASSPDELTDLYLLDTANDELTELLISLGNKKLILIDTEGRSPRDRRLANSLAAFGNNRERVRFYLTLSAATQEAALDEAIRQFRQVPLEGCVVTKIDEAAQIGCIVSALIRHDLPASFFSDGQRVPEDLYAAARKKMWLINQAVESLERTKPQVNERTMAENYAQLSSANA